MSSQKQVNLYAKLIKWLWICLLVMAMSIPLFFIAVQHNFLSLFGGMPALSELENPDPDIASIVFSSEGSVLGKYFSYNRNPVDYDELSIYLVQALVATEDRRYYRHSGIDLKGLVRAFINSFVLQRNREGGSTITQQLAKMLWETRSKKYEGRLGRIPGFRHLINKTKEWLIAIRIERSYTKEEILAMYFNTMPFGNNTFGIRVASRAYFNKLPAELDLHESALLVGVVNGPSFFNPIRHPERAVRRRNWVIRQMYVNKYIDRPLFEEFSGKPIGLNYFNETEPEGMAAFFVHTVLKNDLNRWAEDNGYNLNIDGLSIYTSIDSRMQQHAEKAVRDHLGELQQLFYADWGRTEPWNHLGETYIDLAWKRSSHYARLESQYGEGHDSISIIANTPVSMRVFAWTGDKDTVMTPLDSVKYFKKILHPGFMAMDPHNGHIKAWVGGSDYRYFKYDHVKQGKNQPGSTFKPFVYATAIENGYSPCYTATDAPVTFQSPGANPPFWMPENSSNAYNGQTMTLRQALGRSVNRIAAWMMSRVGVENVIDMARRLGIESELQPVMSLSLGTSDVSLFEMLGAYSVFVNDGAWTEPHALLKIEDKFGNVVYESSPKTKDAISEETAYVMLHMLRGTVEEEGGTARGLDPLLKENNEIGAKTGTTSDYADGWFIGITEDLVAGAWVGGDDRAIHFPNIVHGQGAVMAMPIWEKFMLEVYNDNALRIEKKPFERPSTPVSFNLDCEENMVE